MISILISSFQRLPLFRRTIYSIWKNKPSQPFEVIVADEINPESDLILSELRKYESDFAWKFLRCSMEEFEKQTGIKKFFNNPSWTNNCAFKHSKGDLIFLVGNDIILWDDCLNKMIGEIPPNKNWIIFSQTFNLDDQVLPYIDPMGNNISPQIINYAKQFPLQTPQYMSDVPNYCSLISRQLWERVGGYDERYMGGISSEDSDFIGRIRTTEDFMTVRGNAVCLHQAHGGKTIFNDPKPEVITVERFNEGCAINHRLFREWDGRTTNKQSWPIGEGVMEVISNG